MSRLAALLPTFLASLALAQSVNVTPGVDLTPAGAANAAEAAKQAPAEVAAPPAAAPAPAVTTPAAPATPAATAETGPDRKAFLFTGALADFSQDAYDRTVERLIAAYERDTGRALKPGKKGKVALKLYTASGAGLATPQALTLAVAAAMEKRGFARADILLLDQQEERLREAGYLPAIRDDKPHEYKGMPVLALDTGKYFDPKPDSIWTYPSPLPSKDIPPNPDNFSFEPDRRERVSQLPIPLMFGVDFWINLPCACDSPATGVSGAIANASILAVGNAKRFADNPANAQKAALDIASIRELNSKWEFSILPLEKYQFIGGPRYDAAFTVSEKQLWLSANPVILDHLMWRRFNTNRKKLGFAEIFPEPAMFVAANSGEIHLGTCRPSELNLVRTDPAPSGDDTPKPKN